MSRQRTPYYRNLAPTLFANGYEIIPVVPGGKRPAQGAEWQNKVPKTEAEVIRLTPNFGAGSIGIVGRTTPAFDFDILHPGLSAYMLKVAMKLLGDRVPVRFGHRPKFLMPGRWIGGDAPAKCVSKGYVAADADLNDPKLIVNRIERLGTGQQWVGFGDHDVAEAIYTYLNDKLSPLTIPHDQLVIFSQELFDQIIEEYEWAAENQFGLIEYVRPGRGGFEGGAANGAVYEPMAGPARLQEDAFEIARVRTALAFYSATRMGRDYDSYLEVFMAVSWLRWECGLALFLEWSRKSPWHVEKDAKYWFEKASVRNDRASITVSTLFARAKHAGWDGEPAFDELPEEDEPAEVPGASNDDDDLAGPDKSDGDGATTQAKVTTGSLLRGMNEKFAVVGWGNETIILDLKSEVEISEGEFREYPRPISSKSFALKLHNQYAPRKTTKTPLRRMDELWLGWIERKEYKAAIFAPPPFKVPQDYLNLWTGFAVEPAKGNVKPWLDLVDGMIHDPVVKDYFLKWCAWKIQNPGGVPGTIALLTGTKGTGKNAIAEVVCDLFGNHGWVFVSPEPIVGKYNEHMKTLAFAVLDEAVFIGDPRQADAVKSRITATKMTFEEKFQPLSSGFNRCAYINLTNHLHVWQASIDERRAFVVEVQPTLKDNTAFWTAFFAWRNSAPALPAMLEFLQSIDLRGFNVRSPPKTEALARQVKLTQMEDPLHQWWHTCLEDQTIYGIGTTAGGAVAISQTERNDIPCELIEASYLAFTKNIRSNRIKNWQRVAGDFMKLAGAVKNRPRLQADNNIVERRYFYSCPSGVIMADEFLRQIGVRIDDDDL